MSRIRQRKEKGHARRTPVSAKSHTSRLFREYFCQRQKNQLHTWRANCKRNISRNCEQKQVFMTFLNNTNFHIAVVRGASQTPTHKFAQYQALMSSNNNVVLFGLLPSKKRMKVSRACNLRACCKASQVFQTFLRPQPQSRFIYTFYELRINFSPLSETGTRRSGDCAT